MPEWDPMSEPSTVMVVLVTGPDETTLESMAECVVAEGLAACVNIIPDVRSVYRWREQVETGREALAIIKTTRSAVEDLQSRVLDLHPYEVPEFIVLPVDSGNPSYLDWVTTSITAKADS